MRVPVLSVQITLVEPRVSTAASLRTRARRRAMRMTPRESATVTTAGSPSGTAATARLMDVMNNSIGAVPRNKPSPNKSTTTPSATHTRMRPKASSLVWRGVELSPSASWISSAMPPSSVFIDVATTSARPVPADTLVPINTMLFLSPRATFCWVKTAVCFLTASDSPVSAASIQVREDASSSRASAATRSPASKARISPATKPAAGRVESFPSRRTLACGAVIFLSAAIDFSALYSW